MKRRTFFTVAGIGAVFAGLGTMRFTATSLEDDAEKIIANELSFLKLDRSGVRQFISDYTLTMTPERKKSLARYCFLGITSKQSQKIRRMMDAYLLSTDFFRNRMDETRTVKYISLYDPQSRPCINPFGRAYFPTEAV